jgi:flagellar biosynthesis component FlhA
VVEKLVNDSNLSIRKHPTSTVALVLPLPAFLLTVFLVLSLQLFLLSLALTTTSPSLSALKVLCS